MWNKIWSQETWSTPPTPFEYLKIFIVVVSGYCVNVEAEGNMGVCFLHSESQVVSLVAGAFTH